MVFRNILSKVSKNKYIRRSVLILIDIVIINLAFLLSLLLTNHDLIQSFKLDIVSFSTIAGIIIYFISGQYKPITKYTVNSSIYKILMRNITLIFLLSLQVKLFSNTSLNNNFYLTLLALLTIIIIVSRVFLTDLILFTIKFESQKRNKYDSIVIYGAGSAGIELFASLKYSKNKKVMFFVDDNNNLHNRNIDETSIYDPSILKKYKNKIDFVYLAIPSISWKRKTEIIKKVKYYGIKLQIVPSLEDITSGKSNIDLLKPLNITDLLGRNPVVPNKKLLKESIENKNICVTGAGGSIGAEICKSALDYNPKSIILIDNSEWNLYKINEELKSIDSNSEIKPYLTNLCDISSVKNIFDNNKIDCIFHAAAYKHVPLVEKNPITGLKNNLLSTKNICEISFLNKIPKVILVSSDKAVRPTNIMGASKRLCELIFLDYQGKFNKKNSSNFSIVRFGNVLGSSGSVVPLFKKQISEGGPITITHPEIIRYFMTLKEAAQLVIQSSHFSKGGEVFVLDMGLPVKILDLAKEMIQLSGLEEKTDLTPNGDIEIIYTGLRPGEKLFEEILIESNSQKTEHPLIYKAYENAQFKFNFSQKLGDLIIHIDKFDEAKVFQNLSEIIPEWQLSKNIKDFVGKS